MKNIINVTTIVIASLLAFTLVSCENNITSPADPISTDNYPTLTFTTDFDGNTVAEGDAITYEITADKPFEEPVEIVLTVSGGDADTDDYEAESFVFPAFSPDATISFTVEFTMDDIPEEAEEFTYSLEIPAIDEKYTVNPDTEFPEKTVTIENVNDPTGLTVALGWDTPDDDLDLLINYHDVENDSLVSFSAAASADNPEISLLGTSTTGDFYYLVDPYSVGQANVNYTFSVGYPDQSVELFEGVLETENLDQYTLDPFHAFGYTAVPRLLEVNVSASGTFSVTHLN